MNFRRKGDVIKASMGGKKKKHRRAQTTGDVATCIFLSFFFFPPFFFPKIVKKRGGESRVSLSHHLRLFFHFRSTSVPATAPFFFSFFSFPEHLEVHLCVCVFFFLSFLLSE